MKYRKMNNKQRKEIIEEEIETIKIECVKTANKIRTAQEYPYRELEKQEQRLIRKAELEEVLKQIKK